MIINQDLKEYCEDSLIISIERQWNRECLNTVNEYKHEPMITNMERKIIRNFKKSIKNK